MKWFRSRAADHGSEAVAKPPVPSHGRAASASLGVSPASGESQQLLLQAKALQRKPHRRSAPLRSSANCSYRMVPGGLAQGTNGVSRAACSRRRRRPFTSDKRSFDPATSRGGRNVRPAKRLVATRWGRDRKPTDDVELFGRESLQEFTSVPLPRSIRHRGASMKAHLACRRGVDAPL
jgi:hypothetical protein